MRRLFTAVALLLGTMAGVAAADNASLSAPDTARVRQVVLVTADRVTPGAYRLSLFSQPRPGRICAAKVASSRARAADDENPGTRITLRGRVPRRLRCFHGATKLAKVKVRAGRYTFVLCHPATATTCDDRFSDLRRDVTIVR